MSMTNDDESYIETNNCVIFPKMSMTNDDESYIETSSESTMENENQNLINLNEDINNQSKNNLNNTHRQFYLY